MTTTQERADVLAGNVVNLPELLVSFENELQAIKYLKKHHDFEGKVKISRELPKKAKVAIKAKGTTRISMT